MFVASPCTGLRIPSHTQWDPWPTPRFTSHIPLQGSGYDWLLSSPDHDKRVSHPGRQRSRRLRCLLQLKRAEVYNARALVEEVSAIIRELEGPQLRRLSLRHCWRCATCCGRLRYACLCRFSDCKHALNAVFLGEESPQRLLLYRPRGRNSAIATWLLGHAGIPGNEWAFWPSGAG